MVFDPQLLAKVPQCVVIKLFSIISDEDSRDAKAANDAFPDEASDILLGDSGQRFYLNPFSEIVNSYDKGLKLLHCHGKGPHFAEPPLSEWPGSIHWGKLFQRFLYDVIEALAFVAHLQVGLSVLLHSGPIVPYSYEFVNQRLCSRMISTYSLMDFPHDVVCFVEDQASQVRTREIPFVKDNPNTKRDDHTFSLREAL